MFSYIAGRRYSMRIASSDITMSGKSISMKHYTKEESLRIWNQNDSANSNRQNSPANPNNTFQSDTLQISDEGKSLQMINSTGTNKLESDNSLVLQLSEKDKQKILLLEKLIEAFTGKKFRFKVLDRIKIDPEKVNITPDLKIISPQAQPNLGWGVEYAFRETYHEKEQMSFNSSGVIKTADGKEINFSVSLNMSREFYSENSIIFKAEDAARKIDPLVIHFDGPPTGLTDVKFSFDLDSNGTPEQISFVSQGSGFLCLDLNNDGKINNGSELFGPDSGDGFRELAAYDSDGNNWIDENDPVYDKLRIWTKDENGKDVLFALGQKGIGAIYLGNVDTSFELKNRENESLGQIQKTGIYVKEDYSVGMIHHIDLSV
jgi:hypothetical protein